MTTDTTGGSVRIADRGSTREVVLPGPHRVYGRRIPYGTTFETAYRRETINALLAVKGPEWLKDEIDRAEDPDYLLRAVRTIFGRYETFRGRQVLDFGCGCGATTVVLARLGARVVGVDPDAPSIGAARLRAVDAGIAAAAGFGATAGAQRLVAAEGAQGLDATDTAHDFASIATVPATPGRANFRHIPNPLRLPFADGAFEAVLAYQVVEHIPPAARAAHLRELWRVLAPGGRLLISAPNRLWPVEFHTTGLVGVPWLPDAIALRYAVLRGRLPRAVVANPALAEGFRGLGYWELLRWLPASETRVLNGWRRDDLEAWLDLSLSRDQAASRERAKRWLHRCYATLDETVWRRLDWPAAAFLPYLNVAIEKIPAAVESAPRR